MEKTPRLSHKDLSLSKDEFMKKFMDHYYDPHFRPLDLQIKEIAEVAWSNYENSRKAPLTKKAGEDFQDPHYDLSQEWLWAREKIREAQERYIDSNSPRRVLLISGSNRNDQTCPGEISKSSRLVAHAKATLEKNNIEVKILDLSLVTSEYGKTIHPCKGCVSTAMPLCHWPCSCYPNHSLGQIHDWMNEIYPMWVEAHGIFIVTPVYWLQVPSSLKLMIDRLVCADGGNPDPTSTQGKKAALAKMLEENWPYPKHLQGRIYSLFVHGDAEGVDHVKDLLADWLEAMELKPAQPLSALARYVDYYGKYSESHAALDKDLAVFKEIENLSIALAYSLKTEKDLVPPKLIDPRPK